VSDIRKYKVALTSRLLLKGADDEQMYADGADGLPDLSKPMAVNLCGPGSKQYANASNARQNRQVDLLKSKGKTKETTETARRESAEFWRHAQNPSRTWTMTVSPVMILPSLFIQTARSVSLPIRRRHTFGTGEISRSPLRRPQPLRPSKRLAEHYAGEGEE